MKKLWDEDLKLNDLRALVNTGRLKNKNNLWIAIFAAIGIIAAAAAIAYAIGKLCKKSEEYDFDDFDYDDDEDFYDEDGLSFTDEDDFEV